MSDKHQKGIIVGGQAESKRSVSETLPHRSIDCGLLPGRPSLIESWRKPLALQPSLLTRVLTRFLISGVTRRVQVVGIENTKPEYDPYILVLNHSQKLEALLIPAIVAFHRQGKVVHFLADWNFCLVPGIWLFYYAGQVITIARKPAKPRILEIFRPLFTDPSSSFGRAYQALNEGRSLGIFPEGTTNRHPTQLLKGYSGAAQLSLKTGVPVLPAGVRFPSQPDSKPIPEFAPMVIEFGEPMAPPLRSERPTLREIRNWHAELMNEISRLSNKQWKFQNRRK